MTMRRRRCRRANWLVEATWIVLLVVLCYIHNNAVNADDEEWRRGGLKVTFFVGIEGGKGKAQKALKVGYGNVERMVRDAVEDNKQSTPAEGGKWLYVWGYLDCVFGVIVYGGGGGGAAENDPCELLLQKMGEEKDAKYPTVFEKKAVMGKTGVYAAWGKPPDMMTANTKAPRYTFCTIEYVLFRIPDWMTYLEKVTAPSHTIYYTVLPKEDWRAFSMLEKVPTYPIPDDQVMMKVDLMQPNKKRAE